MNITIDEIAQAEAGLVEIEKEIREARFHEDIEREEYMLKEKLDTLKFLASAEKQESIRRN